MHSVEMRNLARGILVVVGLFVLALTVTLIVRARTARIDTIPSPASAADLSIKEVDLEEETKGVRWRLQAEQAHLFERESRTTLRRLAVQVIEPERQWSIVGDEGELNTETKDVEIRRNVVVTSSDGLRLDTSVLRWDAEGKRLWTDAPVTLSRKGSIVEGTGLVVRIADEVATVAGRVRAQFTMGRDR